MKTKKRKPKSNTRPKPKLTSLLGSNLGMLPGPQRFGEKRPGDEHSPESTRPMS